MGNCFLHGNGGSASLNFKVVGGTTQPSNPTDNTIWVNTSEKITSWSFSAAEPAMEDGEVWFRNGESAPGSFNALKKNGIHLCPIRAKQNINGVVTAITAKIWQNGEWVDLWDGALFDNGDQYESITGGWCNNDGEQASGTTLSASYWSAPTTRGPFWRTVNKVDLTDYSTLKAHFTEASGAFMLLVGTETPWGTGGDASSVNHSGTSEETALDITTLEGEYYVFLATVNSGENNFTADKVWLE